MPMPSIDLSKLTDKVKSKFDNKKVDTETGKDSSKEASKNEGFEKIKSFLYRLIPVKGLGGEHLVFSYDGYVLSGAIVKVHAGKLQLVCTGLSTKMNMQRAIEDILSQFQDQNVHSIPRHAVLASAEVVEGRVDIPVNSSSPKPKTQMRELVRWELESTISDAVQIWSVGALLEGYGFISAEQRQNASVELELARSQGAGMIRFGEICIQQGYINREQLNEMMALQERLMSMDGRMDCSWKPQLNDDEADEGTDVWLGAGVYRHSRRHWLDAFFRNGITLNNIVPIHGLGALFIDDADGESYEQILIEVFKERVVIIRFMGKAVVSISHLRFNHKDELQNIILAGVSELMRPETEAIWFSSVLSGSGDLIESLSASLGTTINSIQSKVVALNSGLRVPEAFIYQFYALARLAEGAKCNCVLFIDAQDPKPPLWKNANVWRFSAPVILVAVIVANEIYMHNAIANAMQRQANVEKEKEEKKRLSQQIKKLISEVAEDKKVLAQVSKELNNKNEDISRMKILLKRNELTINLLLELQASMNDQVFVDRYTEQGQGYELVGWAANDNAAQLFSRTLDANIGSLKYEVRRLKLNRSIGRSGLRGYGFSMLLLPESK